MAINASEDSFEMILPEGFNDYNNEVNLEQETLGENNQEEEFVNYDDLNFEDETQEVDEEEFHSIMMNQMRSYLGVEDYASEAKTTDDLVGVLIQDMYSTVESEVKSKMPAEIQEAYDLFLEGKISSVKEFLNYSSQDDFGTANVFTEDDRDNAIKFITKFRRETTGDEDEDIELFIENLELKDKLIDYANSKSESVFEKKKQEITSKKQEYLKQQEVVKQEVEVKRQVFQEKVDFVIKSQKWDDNVKKYAKVETSNGAKQTIEFIQHALNDAEIAPDFIVTLSRLFEKDKKGTIKYTKKLFEDIKKSADGESVEKTLKKTLNSSAFKGLNKGSLGKKQGDFSGGYDPVY
jgi:hypothetical protein